MALAASFISLSWTVASKKTISFAYNYFCGSICNWPNDNRYSIRIAHKYKIDKDKRFAINLLLLFSLLLLMALRFVRYCCLRLFVAQQLTE